MSTIDTNVKLLSLELTNTFLDGNTGGTTLQAVYQVNESNGAINEVTFPQILLPFYTDRLPDIRPGFRDDIIDADFGFGLVALLPDENGTAYMSKVIKKADPVNMTIAEIEKKLGYPVKIVKEEIR